MVYGFSQSYALRAPLAVATPNEHCCSYCTIFSNGVYSLPCCTLTDWDEDNLSLTLTAIYGLLPQSTCSIN